MDGIRGALGHVVKGPILIWVAINSDLCYLKDLYVKGSWVVKLNPKRMDGIQDM
jgi:hypothetical protein